MSREKKPSNVPMPIRQPDGQPYDKHVTALADAAVAPVAAALAAHEADPDAHKGEKNSIEIDAGDLQLKGDQAAPGNNKVYGTDGAGVKGWKADPAGAGSGPVLDRVIPTGDTVTIADTQCLLLVDYVQVEGTGTLAIEGDGALAIL